MEIIVAAIGLIGFGLLQILKVFIAAKCTKHCKKCKKEKK